eukprot:scaffold24489_cov147-Cylindrotheca_fusiformis.AAC.3
MLHTSNEQYFFQNKAKCKLRGDDEYSEEGGDFSDSSFNMSSLCRYELYLEPCLKSSKELFLLVFCIYPSI